MKKYLSITSAMSHSSKLELNKDIRKETFDTKSIRLWMRRCLVIISTLIVIIGGAVILNEYRAKGPVYGEGGIEVTYQQTPLFNVSSIAPGQQVAGRVTVKSTSSLSQKVGLKIHAGRLADILTSGKFTLKVKDVDSGAIIFGGDNGKKLLSFFLMPNETQILTLNPFQSKNLDIIISMDSQSGNFYQGRGLSFDLSLGFIASNKFSIK